MAFCNAKFKMRNVKWTLFTKIWYIKGLEWREICEY